MTTKELQNGFSQAICADFKKSGLTPDDAARMDWSMDPAGNLVIPYNNGTGFARTRLTEPRPIKRGNKITYQRYSQPRGTTPELFLPNLGGIDWSTVKADASIPIIVTEGEKKAAAACKVELVCIGLGGVDCWAAKGGVPLPQWAEFDLKGREVKIVFDSDLAIKPQVRSARRRLAHMLSMRGATVYSVDLPATDDEKVGLDDFLVANGLGAGDLQGAKAAFEQLPKVHIPVIPSADEVTAEFNQTLAIVAIKGQTLIQEECVGPDGIKSVQYLKLADFNLRMRNRDAISADGKPVTAAAAWLSHPNRREYKRIVFEPDGAGADDYNLWQGCNVVPVPGDCSLILSHIREVVCGCDERAYEYLIAWCADILQNPANRPGVAVALRGEEGVGKGFFGQLLMKLTAPHSVQVTQGHLIIGRFNSIAQGKILVFMDEAFWAGDKASEGPLKGLITERELVVEHKGKEPYAISNYARILMASNSDWVVPAGPGARRYVVLDVSDTHKGDTAYFKALSDHIDNGGLAAFADHLLKVDLSGIDLRKPPMTNALLDQKLESMDSPLRFIHEMLVEAVNTIEEKWRSVVPKSQLYQHYAESSKNQFGRIVSQNKFGKTLVKVLKPENGRPMVDGIRHHAWHFPPLEECRKRFSTFMEADMVWPETDPAPSGGSPGSKPKGSSKGRRKF